MTDNPFARYVTDAVQRAAYDAWCDYWGEPDLLMTCPTCNGDGNQHGEPCDFCGGGGEYQGGEEEDATKAALLAALAIVGPEIQREALEEAAKVADPVPRGWPSSGREPGAWQRRRMHIAAAIRALGKEG